jgi:hypothetical protein
MQPSGASKDVGMRSTTLRFLVALLPCCAAPLAAADDAPVRLTIHWSDPEKQFPFATSDLAAEARALFAPLGIALEWASADTVAARDHVQVILLARDRSGGKMGERTMACVQGGRRTQPAAWILVPQVRAALGLPKERVGGEGPLLSRALARVMAHELIHLVAPDLPHVPGGLMNTTLGRDFLLRPAAPSLDARWTRVIRAAVQAWTAAARA